MLRELKEEDQEALLALNNASTPAVNPLTRGVEEYPIYC